MIALGKRPGLLCKGAQPVDVYVGGHPVTPGITLEDYPLQKASGSVVTCEPLTGYKLGVTSHITAVQEGTGDPSPDNVRPIVGWDQVTVWRTGKNMMPPLAKGYGINANTGTTGKNEKAAASEFIPWNISHPAFISGLLKTLYSFVAAYDSNKQYLGRTGATARGSIAITSGIFPTSVDTAKVAYIRLSHYENDGLTGVIDDIDSARIQMELGSVATPYEPYTGETHAAALPETVYGGTLDWRTGLLTVTHGHIESYAGEDVPDGWISSVGALIEGAQVVYPLTTPYTIQLTPQQLVALAGTNTIYSTSGDTTVTYRIRKT